MGLRNQDAMAPIAVVGISCRLPGGANTPIPCQGGEAWSPVPPDRFNEAAFHHPSADDPNGTTHHQGGHFIDADVRDFDSSFFRLSPQQAAAMDPQQRFLLEMTYEALESAGWTREGVAGSNTSVYTAMFTADYERNLYRDPLDLPVYYITGTEKAILSNRISHYFDLHGPSVTLDTACSGGLVALHQACQSLRDGESSAALVSAANLTLGPDHHVGMSNLHLVGGSGRCYPFDARGAGYGRGEGLVVLALKRLDDALRDRDPVRAVVRATAVNQDGYTPQGITYPNGAAQAALVRAAYARSGGLRPRDVGYVEAHGTGTVAGDTEELNALADVFASSDTAAARSLPLYVGSIKGNIGHTENASGLASLVKAALILEHQQIPPVAGFSTPKPGLPLDVMRIPTQMTPLPVAAGITPTVSLNSFGFGGTNSHAILQRGPRPPPLQGDGGSPSPRLFVFSAHSETSLKKMIRAHIDWLSKEPSPSLANLSYTLCHRRSQLNWRFGCVAEDRPSLIAKLQRAIDGGISSAPSRPRTPDPYVVFVFTGQGAQWAGMGRELFVGSTACPVFQKSIRASGAMLRALGAEWDLGDELLRDAPETRLNTAALAQPATTAIQMALVERLRAQGVRPRAVVGHSSGEIAAAYAAGRISHRAALGVALHRGCVATLPSKMRKGLPGGAMMAVGLGERGVAPFLENLERGRAGVACVNSPSNVTISGDSDAVDEIGERLAADKSGIFHRRLVVDTAYHSHHMQAVADDYLSRLDHLHEIEIPDKRDGGDIAFISSVSGLPKTNGFDSAYWTANLVSQVRFCDAIQTLVSHRISEGSGRDALFIELGPHNALSGPVRQTITAPGGPRVDFDYYSALQRKVDALSSILSLASSLFERGVRSEMDHVTRLTQGSKTANVCVDLPSYPWDHEDKHWHLSRVSRQYLMRPDPYHDLLGVRVADSTSIEPRWRHMICLSTLPWLAHHVVDGLVVFPGSGYLCMATEAMRQVFSERHSSPSAAPRQEQQLETIIFRDVAFHRALVMHLSFDPQPAKSLELAFRITAFTDGHWHEHCSGLVEAIVADCAEPSTKRSLETSFDGTINLDPQELYSELAGVGNTYGPTFTGIKSLAMTSDAAQAKSTVEVPNVADLMPAAHQAPHLIHPATLDILLHTALPLVGRRLGPGSVMPTHIDELVLSATDTLPHRPGSILEALTTLKSSNGLRTSHADLAVTSGGIPVLAASGIEMRSLGAAQDHPGGSAVAEGICYELDWKPDSHYISTADSQTKHLSFENMVSLIHFKHGEISILELGMGNEELSLAFIDVFINRGHRMASYNLVGTSSQHTAKVQGKLEAHRVPCSILILEEVDNEPMPKPSSYDVILVSDPSMLARASTLIESGGTLLAHSEAELDMRNNAWIAAAQAVPVPIEVQMICREKDHRSAVLLARRGSDIRNIITTNCRIITHSKERSDTADWARALGLSLQKTCPGLITDSFDTGAATTADCDDACILVVDDQAQPILSDPACFDAVAALLNQPARIVWVSPDSPMSMHQITGVARTAHAENYKLRLTTIHAAPEQLGSEQLHNLVAECMRGVIKATDDDSESGREREYWLRGDGTVLIPRLRRSDDLNLVIQDTTGGVHDTSSNTVEQRAFTDPDCPVVMSTEGASKTAGRFVRDHSLGGPLAMDEIDIQTEAFSLTRETFTGGLSEYVGVISQIGAGVRDLAPGDRVLTVSSSTAASRLRISQPAASCIPPDVPVTCISMLLNLMAASHALHKLADLTAASVVLLHDALSPQGRAAVAVARYMGVRAIFTATDRSEAVKIAEGLNIPEDDVLLSRPSLYRQPLAGVCPDGLDAIFLAGGEPNVPQEALSQLKPFGCVITMNPSSRLDAAQHSKLPSNTTVYNCDIAELLRCRPENTATLVRQAAAALPYLNMDGLDLCSRNVDKIAEAVRMVESGAQSRVVITVQKDSMVNTLVIPKHDHGSNTGGGGWKKDDVSYVIAGGFGDLGKRLMLLMARRGAKHLVTLSRSLPSDKDKVAFEAQLVATQPGCRLHCISCDLTSEASVQQAAATMHRNGLSPVRGVIHSAAILHDRPLTIMTHEEFRVASQVKVEGTLLLERAFGSPSLDFFLMLSSAVNIVGASGQANYNAGNAVQDGLAQLRRREEEELGEVRNHCRYISLNIGWIEDALHTADNDARNSGLGRAGLRAIRSDELSRFFDHVLGAAIVISPGRSRLSQAVIGFDSASLCNATSSSSNIFSPMFSHVRRSSMLTTAAEGIAPESQSLPTAASFKRVLASDDDDALLDFVSAAICGQLAKLISVDASRVDAGQSSMLELGLDSLVAIELRNWLMRTFDAPLQSSEIMDDQTIRALGAKVVSRSRLCETPPLPPTNGINGINGHDERESNTDMELNGTTSHASEGDSKTADIIAAASDRNPRLPPLPVPSLRDALRMFEESRQAIDPAEEQAVTAMHVQSFAAGIGPSLQQIVEDERKSTTDTADSVGPSIIADGYERQIYLERREPLQDYSEFTVGHPLAALAHSQATRAAIVTVAAAEFARRLAAGKVPTDTLHGTPMTGEARDWLFWATRRPGDEVDRMERHGLPSSHDSVVVLRRGHVFELDIGSEQDGSLQISGVQAAFDKILSLSEEPVSSICSLTASDRKSWFLARNELETNPSNAQILHTIDSAMFVVCLDDESPASSGSATQFLLGGQARPFTNRWLDKPVQFAVTSNGLSAGIFEHAKIDGLDVRTLHRHIIRALFADHHCRRLPNGQNVLIANGAYPGTATAMPAETPYYPVRHHYWCLTPTILSRAEDVQAQCLRSYGYIDHRYFTAKELAPDRLRESRASPHATAHLAALLAVYLVDKECRPAWEIVSLGTWAGGRIDWVQTVSPTVRIFLEKAASILLGADGVINGDTPQQTLRHHFDTAARGYSQTMVAAGRGHGYVSHMYALLSAFTTKYQPASARDDNRSEDVPALFRNHAWNATRRGGLDQGLKIGFMPDVEEGSDDYPGAWDEGGFLTDGERGVYIHCGIRSHGITFAVSARPEYADAVCEALDRASSLIASLFD
ncbi:uncharacterized protein PG998_011542 [Apiospora kogelbergensis]|uniref:uncharacterized protein n=1 Tax=Apiospora kogelbergensis TaxID=1337665 RepID=UPI00312D219A